MVGGGLLISDNVISHKRELAAFITMVEADESMDSVTLPVGKGLLVCRKLED